MTLNELKKIIDLHVRNGYGDMLVVYRDEDTDPDLDIEMVYPDLEADRFIIGGYIWD